MGTTQVDGDRLRRLVVRERRLTERYPALYPLAVRVLCQLANRVHWMVLHSPLTGTEIWRDVIDRRSGDRVGAERLRSNCALVRYVPSGVEIRDVTPEVGAVVADPRAQR